MIKFFRKIRQKLLSENKFSKYLIYAIGEIILVVIGILIALGINNLNISKQENKEFQIILNSLEKDIKLDIQRLNQLTEIAPKKERYWSTITENRHIDSLTSNLILELGQARIPVNNAGYISAISDNKLNLISNEDLKSKIISYYNNELKYWESQVITMANIHHQIMEQTVEHTIDINDKSKFTDRVELLLADASYQE